MILSECIKANTRYTRSINIERDGVIGAPARPYVLTARARQTLGRILDSFGRKETPRSWALVGPYGSGKSAFGLFLSALLAEARTKASASARDALKHGAPELHRQLESILRKRKPLCSILITGSPDPLGRRIIQAMKVAAAKYFVDKRAPAIVKDLDRALKKGEVTVGEVIALLADLQAAVADRGGAGVLLVIDELGKFLEYEARHRGSEVFLLQTLAEHSVRSTETPLLVVGLMHQALELYANRFGDELKNEWKKVSGRYESIPFLENSEQTMRVIQEALVQELPKTLASRVAEECKRITPILAELGCLPSGLSMKEAEQIFARCYPLHPISLIVLPILCQKVAQNERTLFSYLGSHEPHGFLEKLQGMKAGEKLPWVRPADVYEYFIQNQPGLTVDHTTHRRWAEVVTALERLGDATEDEAELVKTIGLLNIVGAQNGLKASEGVLTACFGSQERLAIAMDATLRKSVITFRKFSGEYRVWQGTDFDLDTALAEQRSQMGRIDVAELLNERRSVNPMVARRHTIATGTLRYFSPIFVSLSSAGNLHVRKAPTAFLCIAEGPEEMRALEKRISSLGGPTIAAIYPEGSALRDAIVEVQALKRVQRQSQELANDPVAQRELKDRLSSADALERQLVRSLLEQPETTDWFVGGQRVRVRSKRDLQVRISSLLDNVYSKAPFLRNELINRDTPSSNANAGRKKLFMAMLEHSQEKDLGIEKFPAEKAMYRSILRATKLHAERESGWVFQAPPSGAKDSARMRPSWDAVTGLLGKEDGPAVSLETIYATLSREPFGIKEGVLPVLLIAMYQAMNKEVALCESGHFVPFVTQEVLEGILKAPEAYTLQRVHTNTAQRALHSAYASVLFGSAEVSSTTSLVAMLQPLAKMMLSLPDYSRRTKRMSHEAVAIRDLFLSAKTPVQLLFVDIPAACGVDLSEGADLQMQCDMFSRKLKAALNEIKVTYHSLLSDVTEAIRTAFGLRQSLMLHELREAVRARCQGLDAFTIDQQGLKAFLGRLCDPFGDESQWLISVATFLARKPPEKWGDDDLQACEFRLREFVSRLNDLRQLQLHYERGGSAGEKHFEAALLRLVSTEDGESQAVVTFDKQTQQFAADKAREISGALGALPSVELRLAVLVTLLRSMLTPQTSKDEQEASNKVA